MAIAQDSSTPAWADTWGIGAAQASGPFSQATTSFSPPANSLVVVPVVGSYYSFMTYQTIGITAADSLSNSYAAAVSRPVYNGSIQAYGATVIFWKYYASAPGSIHVDVTMPADHIDTQSTSLDIDVVVLTGCSPDQSGAGTQTLIYEDATAIAAELTLTTTVTGSWAWVVSGGMTNPNTPVNVTVRAHASPDSNSNVYDTARMTTPTGTPGNVTLGYSDAQSTYFTMSAWEVLPAGAGGTDSDPAYASSYREISGGSGSWTNPSYAEGEPDSSWATWSPP